MGCLDLHYALRSESLYTGNLVNNFAQFGDFLTKIPLSAPSFSP